MKSTSNTTGERKLYSQPMIDSIKLDNEISLQLESGPGPAVAPPTDPANLMNPNFINQDPFKTTMA